MAHCLFRPLGCHLVEMKLKLFSFGGDKYLILGKFCLFWKIVVETYYQLFSRKTKMGDSPYHKNTFKSIEAEQLKVINCSGHVVVLICLQKDKWRQSGNSEKAALFSTWPAFLGDLSMLHFRRIVYIISYHHRVIFLTGRPLKMPRLPPPPHTLWKSSKYGGWE